MTDSGHLFIINGDTTMLICDAVLVPTDNAMWVEPGWNSLVDREPGECGPLLAPTTEWIAGKSLTQRFKAAGDRAPAVWLANVAPMEGHEDKRMKAVRCFLDEASVGPNASIPRLALPVVGTGRGGAADDKGEVSADLVELLARYTADNAVDVVLVTHGWRPYSAAQRIRKRLLTNEGAERRNWDLGDRTAELHGVAGDLASHARRGNLVPFIGAGISRGAGAKLWGNLLKNLYEDATGDSDGWDDVEHLLDPRDQATVISGLFDQRGDGRRMADAVSEQLKELGGYTLSHGLVSGLRAREAVTTNYDDLYERAVRGSGDELAVLPYQALGEGDSARWLLKLHGCVDHIDDIVLTRDDYLGMPAHSAALFGITQAMLITRHMLFLGYSLADDTFHKVVHEVREAGNVSSKKHSLGTAVFVRDPGRLKDLFGDLEFVSMDDGFGSELGPRRLEIFLDLIGYLAADMSEFLLDRSYYEMLEPYEKKIADSLNAVQANLLEGPGGPTADSVGDMLRQLGGAGGTGA